MDTKDFEENEMTSIFKRANFFPGLKATPAFWNGIENYHFRKETLYNSLFHGFGVVPDYLSSLSVQAQKTKGGLITLIIGDGLAFDGFGRPLFLYKPQILVLDPKKYTIPGTVYVILHYEERMEDYFENEENLDLQGYQHKLETAKPEILSDITDFKSNVELARILLSDEDGKGITEIKNSTGFSDPGVNALDFRFIPWAAHVKQGVSSYLRNFMVELLTLTEAVANSSYEVLPIVSLRSLQTVAMTSRLILQTSGVYFEDVIHIISPLFNMDHQVLFEISEWERTHAEEGRLFTTKTTYENARLSSYAMGDALKSYTQTYDQIDRILKYHKDIIDGIKQTLIEKEVSSEDIKYISYKMPHILLFQDERFTLVDTISFSSEESLTSHNVTFINCKHPSTSNEALYYPDGVLVHDAVKRWIGGEMKFKVRNFMRGRKTVIIRRTDIHQGNYSVDVMFKGKVVKTLVIDGSDTKNRWRNLFVSFEEGELDNFSPELSFNIGEKGRDNSGTIWIYQLM